MGGVVPVVVTGAAGFLGRSVLAYLRSRGDEVVACDRRPMRPAPGSRILIADLLDPDAHAVTAALAAADAVIHLAGCPGVREHGAGVQARRERDNVAATARVLAAVPLAVPLVVVTSASVYGRAARGRASREGDAVAPRGGYARSKVRAEALCLARLGAGGRVAIARPFTAVGEGQRPDMALHRWVLDLSAGRPATVLGSLWSTRDFTDVRDVARALVTLADRGATGAVNIGTGEPRTLHEAVTAVAAALGVSPRLRVRAAHPDEVAHTWADPERLAALTGITPRTDLISVASRVTAELLPTRLIRTG
jgi:nucleoside-diphosphate-sugar epimerase